MGLKRIPLSEIIRNPDQPRQKFAKEPLVELANSIREQGLQQPIVVRPIKSNLSGVPEGVKYMIVLGERRYRAHQLLAEWGKLEDGKILCNIRDMSDEEMHIVAIVENMHRQDVTPLEEAHAFNRLIKTDGMSPEALAGKLGIPQVRVKERLSLLNLDPQLQKFVENGTLPTKNAVEIARLPLHQQIPLLSRIASGELKNWYEIRGVVTGLLEAAEQGTLIEAPVVTQEDVRTLNAMEAKIARVIAVVAAGWKDNECVIAKKVSPDRCRLMAEQLGQLAKSLGLMQRQLLLAAGQGELSGLTSPAGGNVEQAA